MQKITLTSLSLTIMLTACSPSKTYDVDAIANDVFTSKAGYQSPSLLELKADCRVQSGKGNNQGACQTVKQVLIRVQELSSANWHKDFQEMMRREAEGDLKRKQLLEANRQKWLQDHEKAHKAALKKKKQREQKQTDKH